MFFGEADRRRGPSRHNYYVEFADLNGLWDHQGEPPMMHGVKNHCASQDCAPFNYGIEVKVEWPGGSKKASATEAIEDAFQQVTLGQAGLALRLRNARELSFRLLPVVVTTAEVLSADFEVGRVSLDRGMLKHTDLSLKPRRWLAVNYRVNDVICQLSGVTTNRTADLAADLAARQVRTVFVVQAAHIQHFLAWLGESFECATRGTYIDMITIEPERTLAAGMLKLERALSDVVNQAYGMVPEEIALMWQTAPPRMPIPPPAL